MNPIYILNKYIVLIRPPNCIINNIINVTLLLWLHHILIFSRYLFENGLENIILIIIDNIILIVIITTPKSKIIIPM